MSRSLLPGLVAFALSAACVAQAPGDPPRTCDLRVSTERRAVLVDATQTARGTIIVRDGRAKYEHDVDYATDVRWLDEIGAPGGPATHHRRTYMHFRKVDGGAISDPGLDGACIQLTVVDDDVNARAKPPRVLPDAALRREADRGRAVGLFVELPERAEVGAPIAFPCTQLIETLMDVAVSDVEARVTLDRVDSATHGAHLTGKVTFTSLYARGGNRITTSYSADLVAVIDLKARTLASIAIEGVATTSGAGTSKGKFSGEVRFEARATSAVVTDPAPYLKARPEFRDASHLVGGVEVRLKSYWRPLPQKEAATCRFIDSRSEEAAAIEIRTTADDVDPTDPAFIEGFLDSARREVPDVKVAKATFPSGPGITFECTADTDERVRGFVAPIEGGLARVRAVGSRSALRKVDADFKTIQESLASPTDDPASAQGR